jgi:hypothetical protein
MESAEGGYPPGKNQAPFDVDSHAFTGVGIYVFSIYNHNYPHSLGSRPISKASVENGTLGQELP